MKNFKIIFLLVLAGGLFTSCDNFLNFQPKGTISGEQLNTPERVEGLVTAAYSSLGNDHWDTPYSNPWPFATTRSDNAYKGGGGTADQGEYHDYEQFVSLRPSNGKGDRIWFALYRGISRANSAINRINELNEEEYPQKQTRLGEMRFIRGHFHFTLKVLFKRVPYIDESISADSIETVSNRELSNNELWNKIADDFQSAANNLPPDQPEVGRADQIDAKAYLAKTRLYQAYEQNENHEVVNINQDYLQEVVDLTGDIMQSRHDLFPDYSQNFLYEYENGTESLFAVQRSIDDGTDEGRVDMTTGLNYPMSGGFGCCWFNIPSQNLVNAFQTNSDGVPMFDSYNQNSLQDSSDFKDNTVDPRLDHTVSIPTHPFKYDPNLIYDLSWARTPQVYGQFSSMKALQHPDSPSLKEVGPFFASAKNTVIIRYADVILWRAEALIELGRHNDALPLINDIRRRAQNSTDKLQYADGESVSNYNIETYQPGVNIQWTQQNARQALRFERRLEFAMESSRMFDLVRWGIADEVMNDYLEVEKQRYGYLQNAEFTAGRDEYLPIPQQQIDLSEGLYKQNPGY